MSRLNDLASVLGIPAGALVMIGSLVWSIVRTVT